MLQSVGLIGGVIALHWPATDAQRSRLQARSSTVEGRFVPGNLEQGVKRATRSSTTSIRFRSHERSTTIGTILHGKDSKPERKRRSI